MDKLSLPELHLIFCTDVRLLRVAILIKQYIVEGYFALLSKHHTKLTISDLMHIQEWRLLGILHREDGPADIIPKWREKWYFYGRLHREDGPAVTWYDGSEICWYRCGRLSRKNGPAIVRGDGTKEWFWNGMRHRVDGPAIECADGSYSWYRHGRHYNNRSEYYMDRPKFYIILATILVVMIDWLLNL